MNKVVKKLLTSKAARNKAALKALMLTAAVGAFNPWG